MSLGIRGKLLLLAVCIAVPLALVGAFDLLSMWSLSRSQLDESVKQQAELASVGLDKWLDAQQKPLLAIAAMAADTDVTAPDVTDSFRYVVMTRPYWIDLRILNREGQTLVTQPAGHEPPPPALLSYLMTRLRERGSAVVVTDRTNDEARPMVIVAVPTAKGDAVVARVDGEAIRNLFRDIELSNQSVIAVLDASGRILFRRQSAEAPYDRQLSWGALFSALGNERATAVEFTSPFDGIQRVYGVSRTGTTDLVVTIGLPSSTLYQTARLRLYRYILLSILALVVAIAAALVTERSLVTPVRRLRSAAQRFGSGELSARAPVKAGGEIADLGIAFNTMAQQIAEREERLTELDKLKSEFVSSASHELRTPLTTIKTLTHVLQRGGLTEEQRRDYLNTIARECDRQIDLVLNLLDLSRIESGAYRPRRQPTNVAELMRTFAENEGHASQVHNQTLRLEVDPSLPLALTDPDALRRVLRSLTENALKYTPEGGQITLSARWLDGRVAITVADTGCGIRQEDVPHIFDKFYRGQPALASSPLEHPTGSAVASGVGLGLYIAGRIVKQIGGRISVSSTPGEGTIFTLQLPCWNKEEQPATSEEEPNVQAATGS
jgi:signal transduction histidine kinase